MEQDMQTPLGDGYTIHTGSAIGTDSVAEQCVRELGLNVIVMISQGHARSDPHTPEAFSLLSKM